MSRRNSSRLHVAPTDQIQKMQSYDETLSVPKKQGGGMKQKFEEMLKQKNNESVRLIPHEHEEEDSDDSTEVQSISKISKKSKKSWAGQAFMALDTENRGYLLKHELLDHFHHSGVYTHHGLAGLIAYLEAKSHKCPITFEEFNEFSAKDNFVKRVLENNLIIPQYINVKKVLLEAFKEIKEDSEAKYNHGKIASYIPDLANADPDWFATAFCSTDG